nr:hypothetical protein [uncultured bacterium]
MKVEIAYFKSNWTSKFYPTKKKSNLRYDISRDKYYSGTIIFIQLRQKSGLCNYNLGNFYSMYFHLKISFIYRQHSGIEKAQLPKTTKNGEVSLHS